MGNYAKVTTMVTTTGTTTVTTTAIMMAITTATSTHSPLATAKSTSGGTAARRGKATHRASASRITHALNTGSFRTPGAKVGAMAVSSEWRSPKAMASAASIKLLNSQTGSPACTPFELGCLEL